MLILGIEDFEIDRDAVVIALSGGLREASLRLDRAGLCGDLLGIKLPANQRIGDLPERALCRALISGDEFVGPRPAEAELGVTPAPVEDRQQRRATYPSDHRERAI